MPCSVPAGMSDTAHTTHAWSLDSTRVRTWRLGPTYLIEGSRGHDGVDCFEEGLHGLQGVYHVCTEDDLGGADKMLGDGLGPVEEGDGGGGGGGGGREGREGGGRSLRESDAFAHEIDADRVVVCECNIRGS